LEGLQRLLSKHLKLGHGALEVTFFFHQSFLSQVVTEAPDLCICTGIGGGFSLLWMSAYEGSGLMDHFVELMDLACMDGWVGLGRIGWLVVCIFQGLFFCTREGYGLVGRSVGRLVGWLVGWSVGRSVE